MESAQMKILLIKMTQDIVLLLKGLSKELNEIIPPSLAVNDISENYKFVPNNEFYTQIGQKLAKEIK